MHIGRCLTGSTFPEEEEERECDDEGRGDVEKDIGERKQHRLAVDDLVK